MKFKPTGYNPLPLLFKAMEDPNYIEFPHFMLSLIKVECATAGVIIESDEELMGVRDLLMKTYKEYNGRK